MESVKEENLLFANANALIGAAKDARVKILEASAQTIMEQHGASPKRAMKRCEYIGCSVPAVLHNML